MNIKELSNLNTAQFLAADPKISAWVAASAGTGKTKVLTDRLLNLLLHGVTPERILCLTFTKAAASEMANRLMSRLAQWAIIPDLDLRRELKYLTGDESLTPSLISRARQLFFLVLDAPGGMKIQTIHGFCQSVLARFPIEADVPSHFRILDDILSEDLLLEAQHKVFNEPSLKAQKALEILNPYMADQRFAAILKDLYNSRSRILSLLSKYQNLQNYAQKLTQFMEINVFVSSLEDLLEPDILPKIKAQFVPTDQVYEDYVSVYLTQKNEIRKKLSSEQQPEAERAFKFNQSVLALGIAQRTIAILVLFDEIIQEYQNNKSSRGVLDYDDLIYKTQKLLTQSEIASWVLYKLDGGIDHLLIDEAQDTNSSQWDIILSLTQEFFAQGESKRTVFAVGDAKQSIYSFQGANPEDFLRFKEHFANLTQAFGMGWRDVELNLSYRSTAAILTIVDEIFANSQTQQGVSFGKTDIVHHVHREVPIDQLPGLVELWPLISAENYEENTEKCGWPLPLERVEGKSPQLKLAHFLADQIASWIQSKGVLPSTNDSIQPKDILILVRKRGELADEIIRALKKRRIPVAGSDRLVLTDHIAVMDLLALGQFILLPEDDLTLACVLRSPLIGLSEEDLFTLSYGRVGNLWSSLRHKATESSSYEFAYRWLSSCTHEADLLPVYEFYNWVLTQGEGRRRFLSRLGHEVEDALDEFLTQCLVYDREYPSSLQGFVHFISHQNQEIKRDSSDTLHNQVRLMTIHGSKGLQAPIVILPDTGDVRRDKREELLWAEDFLLLRPTKEQNTNKTQFFQEEAEQRHIEEKNRLLYVALTRAQDRLYVGGWTNGKEVAEDSWYRLIQRAVETRSGTNANYYSDHKNLIQDNARSIDYSQKDYVLPDWVHQQYKDSSVKINELDEKKVSDPHAIDRGIIIHRLFEFLPNLPQANRYQAAQQIIAKEGLSITEWERDIQAILHILNDQNYKELFGPDSLAEVPLRGMVNGTLFQGRIDRLRITEDTITIIDYKTNQEIPEKVEDIPISYIKQLEGYSTALRTIYPKHTIRAGILWTAGPVFQMIEK